MWAMLSSTSVSVFLLAMSLIARNPSVSAAPELRILKATPPNGFVIELQNPSDAAVRLWRDSNTWGAARWRAMRIRDGAATLFYQVPTHGFTRNVPGFDELAAKSRIERTFDLTDAIWRSTHPGDRSIRSGDLLIVFYDVPLTDEATRLGVWYGAIAASSSVP